MDQADVYRKMLVASISSVLLELGADTAEREVLGTLTEILQCFITEVGNLTRNYCELSGRNEPLIADIVLAFVDMGFDFSSLEQYVTSCKHPILPSLQPQQPPKQLNMLNILVGGSKQPLPSHIQPYLPQFPDPHAYVRTPTHKQPIIDYESVREKAAAQKKDIEKSLVKFLARTGPIHNLFDTEEANIFPLIATKPPSLPYLSALLPQDQIFDAEDLEYDPKSQMMQQTKKQKEKREQKEIKKEPIEQENKTEEIKVEDNSSSNNVYIDNPYLAATKMPMNESSMDGT